MRLAIVEDDDKVRQQLQTYVLQYFQGRENDVDIRLFADGDEILEDYAADYDLIFLDIQMKRLDGLATAERIRERDEDVYLVFITNLANYAIRGYAVHALDFILKPVNFLMLRQVLMSVERLLDQKPKRYITLPTDTGLTRLDVSQITYVETDGHAVSIYTEKGAYRLRQSMRGMEELLGKYGIHNVTVFGDTRFDRVLDVRNQARDIPEVERFAVGLNRRAEERAVTLIAGSSWPQDEEILIPYFNEHPEMKLIIAPHEIHREHLMYIESLLKRPFVRLSEVMQDLSLIHI